MTRKHNRSTEIFFVMVTAPTKHLYSGAPFLINGSDLETN